MSRAPKVLVLRAPGINCEQETHHAFALAGAAPEYVHVQRLLAEPERIDRAAILAFPGGFAYGDDIASGRVLAHEMRARLGDRLIAFLERGGCALGICNGFQVLVRLGLLPRTQGGPLVQEVTLTHNLSNHYECRWVTLRTEPSRCKFLPAGLELRVPAAHGEGYLLPRDEQLAQLLDDEGFTAFTYRDEAGARTTEYPANPNGSPRGVAGLTDCTGRVLGLMPHPDRAYLPHHMPDWHRNGLARHGDGFVVFEQLVATARAEG